MRGLYICAFDEGGTLSYLSDWRDAFANAGFDVINTVQLGHARSLTALLSLPRYDVFVLGYSCYYGLRNPILRQLVARLSRGAVVGLLQNEFRNFADKVAYFDGLGINVLVSQLPEAMAQEFYSGRTNAKKIISMYHGMFTGIKIHPKPHRQRAIDVGSRGYDYATYLGNEGRAVTIPALLDEIRKAGRLTVDWDTDASKRFQRHEWMEFLGNCRLTPAAEAGSFFVQWSETKRYQVIAFEKDHPNPAFATVYERFLKDDTAHLNGATISPRHFEAIHARTCQILVEGKYNNVLAPGEHYIELKKDRSNIGAVIEEMSDLPHCERIAERAYEHVAASHTLRHRVEQLLHAV